tara:strand:+ start:330 stop:674 length:345 start_codon:yes stop_codon:yes gene_type:complete
MLKNKLKNLPERGTLEIKENIENNQIITIPVGATLIINFGIIFTNNMVINNLGFLINQGILKNNIDATINNKFDAWIINKFIMTNYGTINSKNYYSKIINEGIINNNSIGIINN